MAGYAPNLQGGIGFEQPVQQPNLLGEVANLAGAFMTSASKAPKASQADIVAADKANFYSALQKGQALKEQGKVSQGNRTINSAYRTFVGKYGREYDDVNTAFQDSTGISYDVEATGSAVDTEMIAQTPEFNVTAALIQQQNPDADPSSVFNLAMEKEIQRQATNLQIANIEQQKKVNWYDVEQVYVDKARQTGDTIRGMLSSAQKDQVITPDEAKQIRSFYDNMYGSITKPVGIDQSEWDRYQEEYITPLTQIVEGSIGLGERGTLDQDMSRAMQQIIAKAVAQGKLPATLMVKMQTDTENSYDSLIRLLKEGSKDPKFIDNYDTVLNSTFDELLTWVTEFENQTDLSGLKVDTSAYEQLDGVKKRDALVKGSTLTVLTAGPEQVATSLVETNARLKAITPQALQPEDFSKVFNPTYFAGIDKVFKTNPVIGRQIAQDAVDSINSQRIAISRSLESEARQLGFKLQGGKVIPDPEVMPDHVVKWVDTYFGGDWDAAYAARGKNEQGFTNSYLKASVETAEKNLLPKVRKLAQANASVDQLAEKYLTPEVTGLGGQQGVKGGEGQDTLQDTTYMMPKDVQEDTEFLQTVSNMAAKYGADPSIFIRAMQFETGGTFDPAQRNAAGSGATGLIQFMPATAKELGTTTEELAKMSRVEQMKYVEKYFDSKLSGIKNPTFSDVYMAVLWPAAVGKPDDYVIFRKGTKAYEMNSGLDTNGSGTVTKGEAAAKAFGRTSGSVVAMPAPGQVMNSPRPMARTEAVSPVETKGTTASSSVEAQRAPQGASEGAQATAPAETAKGSPEAAQRVWETLASQTKRMLLNLFGNEEAVIQAIKDKELSPEDLQ